MPTCYYCRNNEHVDTQGIVSVYPKYENRWFCSYNCLHEHKQGGLRVNTTKNKKVKKNVELLD